MKGLLQMRNLNKAILLFIILTSVILRFWQLGNVPHSPDWDEAALGWTSYSIIEMGKDEYGKSFPVILRSFDDYKPALYVYLVVPFIKIFDLNLLAVRLPSAIFGVIAVIGTFYLVKELFEKFKYRERLALLSSFLLAISPWHIQFSRIAFEAQIGLSMNILAVLFFLKGLKNKFFLLPSVIFAVLSIYVYQSEKVYLPILFAVLASIYLKDILKLPRRWVIGTVILGLVLVAPMIYGLFSDKNALLRAKGVSVFSDSTQFLKRSALKISDDRLRGDYLGLIVDNRRVDYVKAVTSGYVSHFSLNWLFVTGDIERHHAPGMGLMYFWELPFLLIGIYILFFYPYPLKTRLTLFAMLLISPIPASITTGVPHAIRNMNFLPVVQILTGIGLIHSFLYVYESKKRIVKWPLIVFGLAIFSFNMIYFLNQYFVQQNYFYSQSWQYGYKEAVEYIRPIESKYEKIIVSNDRPLDQSYMFFLFYLKYDPSVYLSEGGTISGGFREDHKFGKYEFRDISWENEKSGNLYIGRPDDFPTDLGPMKVINYLDGAPAIVIVGK